MAPPVDPRASVRTFTSDALHVRVHPTSADLAQDAACTAHAVLLQALREHGRAAAILATGNSQLRFLEVLTGLGGIDWSLVTLFHMDEYLGLPAAHPASFRRYMRERVEARVAPRVFHYLAGDAEQPLTECHRYEALLRAETIDLCCLGIGENGHLAFNDSPVARFDDAALVKIVRLDERCRQQQVGEGHFPDLATTPLEALTLTIPALCSAARMLAIVPERRKATAVAATLTGPITTACPASILRRQPHCTLFLDDESASALP